MDEIIGGWEVTGIVQWHSGFPQSPGEGFNFATDFFLTGPGTLSAPLNRTSIATWRVFRICSQIRPLLSLTSSRRYREVQGRETFSSGLLFLPSAWMYTNRS